ncbi:MAG: hypothetical protein AABY22_26030 [Nanoarchaeota archaeon]
MLNEEYIERILKRLNERNAKYLLLISKKKLLEEIWVEIENLEKEIADLDNKISVLIPHPEFKKESIG